MVHDCVNETYTQYFWICRYDIIVYMAHIYDLWTLDMLVWIDWIQINRIMFSRTQLSYLCLVGNEGMIRNNYQ